MTSCSVPDLKIVALLRFNSLWFYDNLQLAIYAKAIIGKIYLLHGF